MTRTVLIAFQMVIARKKRKDNHQIGQALQRKMEPVDSLKGPGASTAQDSL